MNCRTGAYHQRNRDEARAASKREIKNTKRRTLRRLNLLWSRANAAIKDAIDDLILARDEGIDGLAHLKA